MGNILYKVYARFDHFESTSFVDIGIFTDKCIAKNIKEKWEHFFKTSYENLFKMPDGWDPKSDDWYEYWFNEGLEADIKDISKDSYEFYWKDSSEYQKISMEYNYIKDFMEVHIEEISINKEIFIDQFKYKEKLEKLMKEFNRDFKLNNVLNN